MFRVLFCASLCCVASLSNQTIPPRPKKETKSHRIWSLCHSRCVIPIPLPPPLYIYASLIHPLIYPSIHTCIQYDKCVAIIQMQALYNMALMVAYGRGVAQDYKEAYRMFQQGAARNHAPSMYFCGIFHLYGHGVSFWIPFAASRILCHN